MRFTFVGKVNFYHNSLLPLAFDLTRSKPSLVLSKQSKLALLRQHLNKCFPTVPVNFYPHLTEYASLIIIDVI